MRIEKRRDLSIVRMDGGACLVIACDSCGGVGQKRGDALLCPNFYVGAYTARVALMEVLCSGAKIAVVADNICNEMHGTGEEIISGIRHEMAKAGMDPGALTGSTEENFETSVTGLGVTVIGAVDSGALRFSPGSEGDYFLLVGTPKVGGEVVMGDDDEIASYSQAQRLLKEDGVREIVPVGSKGAGYECALLAALNGREFVSQDSGVDLKKSAGPATCLVALVSGAFAEVVGSSGEWKDARIIGRLGGLLP